MDVLDEVRRLREAHASPSEEAVATAFARLEREWRVDAAPGRHAPRRARRIRLALVVSGIAVATVVGITVTATVWPQASVPGAAAEVLDAAARIELGTSDPVLQPGQYLRMQTDTAALVTWGPRQGNGGGADSTASWVQHDVDVLYVPADPRGTWIWEREAAAPTVSDESGSDVAAAIAARNALVDGAAASGGHSLDSGYAGPTVYRAPGGVLPSGGGDGGGKPAAIGIPAKTLAAMPRNPDALLAWYQARWNTPGGVFGTIVEQLQWAPVPAKLRAAMFGALARMPGVELAARGGSTATLQLTTAHEGVYRLTLDMRTAAVVSTETFYSAAALTHDVGAVPAGTPNYRTAVATTVVDGLPASLG